ncbi:transglutaminase-like cysteine peptidase [Leptothrix discophora]|uniref:Transglutaminase-like cysteine peptidase n=1 Tax=Leptothrix discophora TaxID=89 RepID=A0ABT9G1D7_LEPDI|nr:transglutaminase-like cysteine peptidase [Leptothrix discophora]MDP4300263.1 transglutaminase-like cysteine peptidase [Leptothrix discophora]
MPRFLPSFKTAKRSHLVTCWAVFGIFLQRSVRTLAGACGLGVMAVLLLAVRDSAAWDVDRLRQSAARQAGQAPDSIRQLVDLVGQLASQDDETRLQQLNQFFNRRVTFRDDIDVWGQIDYWATPIEMLGRGAGDCEDYAIAKYFSLIAAGVQPARLRLVYVKATLAGPGGSSQQAHMVLAYYPVPGASDPAILDNLVAEIRPASRRPDLAPVFSFNAEGLWTGTQGPGAGDPLARLSRWRDLLARARDQGFL